MVKNQVTSVPPAGGSRFVAGSFTRLPTTTGVVSPKRPRGGLSDSKVPVLRGVNLPQDPSNPTPFHRTSLSCSDWLVADWHPTLSLSPVPQ